MRLLPSLFCIATAWTIALLLVHAKPGVPKTSESVFRSFERVQLLEDKGETSASVSDLNGDGLPDIYKFLSTGLVAHWLRRISVGSVRSARSTAGNVAMSALSSMAHAGNAIISASVALTW